MAVGDTMLAESVPLRPPIGDTAPRVLRPKSLGEAVDFLGEAGGRQGALPSRARDAAGVAGAVSGECAAMAG